MVRVRATLAPDDSEFESFRTGNKNTSVHCISGVSEVGAVDRRCATRHSEYLPHARQPALQ
eukprot:581642-Rhodomonas_salina.1